MGCRKNSPGTPCCDGCPSTCTDSLASYYDVSITFNGITKVIRINQLAGLCNYFGSLCWSDATTQDGSYTCTYESDTTIAAVTCPTCDYTIIEYTEYPFSYKSFEHGRPSYWYHQGRIRASYKLFRWKKRRYQVSVSLTQISGVNLRLAVNIVTQERIRFTEENCIKYAYRKITVPACPDRTCTFADGVLTCDVNWDSPPAPTAGAWIGDGTIVASDPQDPFGDPCSSMPDWLYSTYAIEQAFPNCPDESSSDPVSNRGVTCGPDPGPWFTFDTPRDMPNYEQCAHGSPMVCYRNGMIIGNCYQQEDTFLEQSMTYFSLPLVCTALCGTTPVYRDTPQPENGLPTGDIAGGTTTDSNCNPECGVPTFGTISGTGTMPQTRSFIAKPATFNATIC